MSVGTKNFIAGEWVAGVSQVENRNPSDTSDLIGLFEQASGDQLSDALAAAHRAQAEWAEYPLERKQSVLMAIGNEFIAKRWCDLP